MQRVGKGGLVHGSRELEKKNSRFTGIKTDFSRITHHSAFALIFHLYTPYSTKFKRIFSFNEATRVASKQKNTKIAAILE